MRASKGRPATWHHERYFRLWSYVDYYREKLGTSVRNACRYISQREPWSSEGLSAATLRRRYDIARRLHDQKIIGNHFSEHPTVDELLKAKVCFILGREDRQHMMGPFRYRRAEEAYEAWCLEQ